MFGEKKQLNTLTTAYEHPTSEQNAEIDSLISRDFALMVVF